MAEDTEWHGEARKGSAGSTERLAHLRRGLSRPKAVSRLAAVHYKANGPRPVVVVLSCVSAELSDDV